MSIKINSATYYGIEGVLVDVELDISNGLPVFNIVGLGDTSIKESKERVRSAIVNSGFEFPIGRITINLAPADVRKEGSLFDLPIAISILADTNQVNFKNISDFLFLGELSLFGNITKVKGALPLVIEGKNRGIKNFIIPWDNAQECSIVKNVNIYPFKNLKEVVSFLNFRDLMPYESEVSLINCNATIDFKDIIGQESTKRALEIAAAGNHNVLMFGPPGSGKTMLAKAIPSILPELTYEEALDIAKIYSISGILNTEERLNISRPFRNPHHTATKIALIGGGNNLIPGEISLANGGILFLDEILEFSKSVLEVLRQPLEEKTIKISRALGHVTYPANFMLVGAMNPCPCGYYGSDKKECLCSDYDIKKYLSKLSGPMLDRIDIFTFVNTLSYKELTSHNIGETSEDIRKRVKRAREFQLKRFEKDKIICNSDMNNKHIAKYCKLNNKAQDLIKNVFDKYNLSTRAYNKIIKISRTIADLDGRESILKEDITEAINYRRFVDGNII